VGVGDYTARKSDAGRNGVHVVTVPDNNVCIVSEALHQLLCDRGSRRIRNSRRVWSERYDNVRHGYAEVGTFPAQGAETSHDLRRSAARHGRAQHGDLRTVLARVVC
jgi:hypothetical protein